MSQYSRRTTSVKWNGREVHNPVARKLVVALVLVTIPLFMVIGLAFLILMMPVMIVLHPVFRLLGMVGTIRNDGRGNVALKLDGDSFRRAR